MNYLRSTLSDLRDKYAPITHTSTFRNTGQITPEEFLAAGDFLVYKFPSWSWADASSPSKRVTYLPAGKQYLVTRGVPCHRRLDENFAGDAGLEDAVVEDKMDGKAGEGGQGEDDGWLRTGGMAESGAKLVGDVKTLDESEAEEEEIPDMEDEDDDEAIIRENKTEKGSSGKAPLRTYTLYITYTPYYRTPRLYLSGYAGGSPIKPESMMEDIVGDYKDKTVTLEDFPFFDAGVKMASVHPCKHASVMKVLLDRADAALKLRMAKIKAAKAKGTEIEAKDSGLEGLVDDTKLLKITEKEKSGKDGEEWEVLTPEEEEDVAIRVDQYLVVFLKFMASVTPGIEHDFTMGV